MTVDLKLFAVARDLVGCETLQIELAEGSCIGDLRTALAARFPVLENLLPHLMFAVDTQYATDTTPLTTKCEVACIPPVSGG